MSAVPMIARTIGALLLALGLTSSSRTPARKKRGSDGDCGRWSGDDGGDGGGD